MNELTLLIYIPSYNRFERLSEQIDKIVPYLHRYNIDILVSDNSSLDARYKTLHTIYPSEKIRIITNPVNVGANPNIANGFTHSCGFDFLWILSDDDIIRDGAIELIMNSLNKKIDIMYFQMANINMRNDELELKDIISIMNQGLGLISCVIYNSETVFPSIRQAFEYINSGFPHLAVLFSSCNKRGKLRVLQCPYDSIFPAYKPDPPAEPDVYYISTYGFIQLADFIEDKKLRFGFIKGWISDILPTAIIYKNKNRVKYNNLRGYIFAQSLKTYLYYIYKKNSYYVYRISANIYNILKTRFVN